MGDEFDLERKCRVWLPHAHGGQLWKFRRPGRRGGADNLMLLPYLPIVFVEFKDDRPGAKQSAGQSRFEAECELLGQTYWLIDSFELFKLKVYWYVNDPASRLPRPPA